MEAGSGARGSAIARPVLGRCLLQLDRRHYDRLWPSSTLSRVGSEPRRMERRGARQRTGDEPEAHRSPGGARVRVPKVAAAGARLSALQRITDWHSSSARQPLGSRGESFGRSKLGANRSREREAVPPKPQRASARVFSIRTSAVTSRTENWA